MAVEIVMPKLSDTMTEGALVTWFVAEGERVEVGQVLAEIETDKSSVDLEATAAGVVARIVVAAGSEGVAVGEVLVLIEEGAAPASRPSTGSEAAAITATGASTGASGKAAVGTIAGSDARPTEAIVATGDGKGPAEGAPPASVPSADGGPAATPLARRMAAQAGLDLASLAGSGARAKITKVDIERALGIDDRRPAPMPALARAAGAAATPSAGPGGPAAAESSGDAPAPVAPRLDRSPAVFHDEAPSRTRAVIAERLAAAKREVPHFYLSMDVDARRLLKLRKRLKKENPEARITVNDFLLRALALALVRVPEARVAWVDGKLRHWERIDLAVAVEGRGGLVTPVIPSADGYPLGELAAVARALAERARAGRLEPGEYAGGIATLSNLGMFGMTSLYPILNPPQSLIVGAGAIEERPVVRGGKVKPGHTMTLTLAGDHRALDGATGARVLAAMGGLVEAPLSLLV